MKKKQRRGKPKGPSAKARAPGYTSLASHKRNKKVLVAPFNQLPAPVQRASWIDDRLPEFLWAALLTQGLPRKEYLNLFRSVIGAGQYFRENRAFISHSELAKITKTDFSRIFSVVLRNAEARKALSQLLVIGELPDLMHWKEVLPAKQGEGDLTSLARAVAACLDHQSQFSTDIRWLKVAFAAVQHRLMIPKGEIAEALVGYPDVGDMRSVRPMIRSAEMSLSMPDLLPASDWPARFWKYCWENTRCDVEQAEVPSSDFDNRSAAQDIAETYIDLAGHFFRTNSTTAIDARHDGVFGLALYGLTLVLSLMRPHSTRPAGRIVLRSLVEVFLTLGYLLKLDSVDRWRKFRVHGSGQAKLAFLKITQDKSELPKYVDMETLEGLANEDLWQEFVDINVGQWAGSDLRRMSEEAGIKSVYDRYYDWPSAFVHGQWPAVRNTVFTFCGNPLHRLHRVPRPPRSDLEDVSWDAVSIGNKLLELVDVAYPDFPRRLKLEEKTEKT
jgi:hypothetical protein